MAFRSDSDLLKAARAFAAGLRDADGESEVHRFLRHLNSELGDEHFPALIKLVCIIGQSSDVRAKQVLSHGLATTLKRGDMPSGSVSAWGSAGLAERPSSSVAGDGRPRHRLDPIEYLCAWYAQTTHHSLLSKDVFRQSVHDVVSVFDHSPDEARLYREKLAADISALPEGALNRRARDSIKRILHSWEAGESAAAIAQAALQEDTSSSRVADLARQQLLKFQR